MINNNVGFGSTYRPIFNRSSGGSSGGYYGGGCNNNYIYHSDPASYLMYPMLYSTMNNQNTYYNPTAQADLLKATIKEEKKDAIYIKAHPEVEANVAKKAKKRALVGGTVMTALFAAITPLMYNVFEFEKGKIKDIGKVNVALAIGTTIFMGFLGVMSGLGGKKNDIRLERIKYEAENGDIKLECEKNEQKTQDKPQNINISLNVADLQGKTEVNKESNENDK